MALSFQPRIHNRENEIGLAADRCKLAAEKLYRKWSSLFDPEYPELYLDRSGLVYQRTEECLALFQRQCMKVCRLIRLRLTSVDHPSKTLLKKYEYILLQRAKELDVFGKDLRHHNFATPALIVEISTTVVAHMQYLDGLLAIREAEALIDQHDLDDNKISEWENYDDPQWLPTPAPFALSEIEDVAETDSFLSMPPSKPLTKPLPLRRSNRGNQANTAG